MKNILIIFFTIFFISCVPKNEQQTKIRIVDLEGKSRPIATKVPELNAQALASQGTLSQSQKNITNSAPQENLTPNPASNSTDPKPNLPLANPQQDIKNPDGGATAIKEDPNKAIEYDLAQTEITPTEKPIKNKNAVTKKRLKTGAKSSSAEAKKGEFFAQVGYFSNESNADQTLAKMKIFHEGKIETGTGAKTSYRVLLGPFANKKQASAMVHKIVNSGHEAIVVRNK